MTAIMGIMLENRIEESLKFQEILTECGCNIRTRIGLHPIGEYKCINNGINGKKFRRLIREYAHKENVGKMRL